MHIDLLSLKMLLLINTSQSLSNTHTSNLTIIACSETCLNRNNYAKNFGCIIKVVSISNLGGFPFFGGVGGGEDIPMLQGYNAPPSHHLHATLKVRINKKVRCMGDDIQLMEIYVS